MMRQNPELLNDLAAAANELESLVLDIKEAEEQLNEKTEQHRIFSIEKLERDRLISKKLNVGNLMNNEDVEIIYRKREKLLIYYFI